MRVAGAALRPSRRRGLGRYPGARPGPAVGSRPVGGRRGRRPGPNCRRAAGTGPTGSGCAGRARRWIGPGGSRRRQTGPGPARYAGRCGGGRLARVRELPAGRSRRPGRAGADGSSRSHRRGRPELGCVRGRRTCPDAPDRARCRGSARPRSGGRVVGRLAGRPTWDAGDVGAGPARRPGTPACRPDRRCSRGPTPRAGGGRRTGARAAPGQPPGRRLRCRRDPSTGRGGAGPLGRREAPAAPRLDRAARSPGAADPRAPAADRSTPLGRRPVRAPGPAQPDAWAVGLSGGLWAGGAPARCRPGGVRPGRSAGPAMGGLAPSGSPPPNGGRATPTG